jgi:coenzyme F420-0:L-glutamate ligase/coenzyme F420-1:gamma-L-glutamate ligase
MPDPIVLIPVAGIGEIGVGDDLHDAIIEGLAQLGPEQQVKDGDVLVVTQKIVSKAEGRIVTIDHSDADAKRDLVLSLSKRVLRRRGDLIIVETEHGFVCANAGVDLSNVEDGTAALLPLDPDRSARNLRAGLKRSLGVDVGVLISDTFGRAWRNGVCDVAIGGSGIKPILDLRGSYDANGRLLEATEVCIVDELCAAAELVMGKATGVPVAIIRGCPPAWFGEGSVVADVVRSPEGDLFR